jgi:hypothetical protein
MRTTLELPDALVNEAMSITNMPTKTALIKYAYANAICTTDIILTEIIAVHNS